MKRYLLICIILLAGSAGVIYYLLAPPGMPKVAAAPARSALPAPGGTAPMAEVARPVGSQDADVPAWANTKDPADKTSAASGTGRSTVDASAPGRISPEFKAAVDRLAALQGKPDVKPREVAAAIGDMEKASGSSVIGGVRFDVLRQNLLAADEMQKLSEELREMQKEGGLQTAQGRAKFEEKIKQIQAVQSRLKLEVMQSRPGAAIAAKAGTTP